MSAFGAVFLITAAVFLIALPRRLAALPLILTAAYMTYGQLVILGPANFTILRILVAVGFLRVLLRGEHLPDGLHTVDKLILTWAAFLMVTSVFHEFSGWIYRSGLVWTEVGCYFLFRVFLHDLDEVRRFFLILCVALVPLGLLMLLEKFTGHNPFGFLGGVMSNSMVREGHVRAAGPFSHPILAGTTGAMVIAMGLAVQRVSFTRAVAALIGGGCMVLAATSSGPILTVFAVMLGLVFWHVRYRMRVVRWGLLFGIIGLDLVMRDPVYFLMAHIDITGGSQGYYRAQLIRSSIQHLSEWWATGTDYTRHWMASGIYDNDRMVDITNHFLAMGVMGGLLLMAVFITIVAYSFRDVGIALGQHAQAPAEDQIFIWTLGALLFAYVVTFFSISLFDQSIVFFYLCLASIQSCGRQRSASPEALLPSRPPIRAGQRRRRVNAQGPAR